MHFFPIKKHFPSQGHSAIMVLETSLTDEAEVKGCLNITTFFAYIKKLVLSNVFMVNGILEAMIFNSLLSTTEASKRKKADKIFSKKIQQHQKLDILNAKELRETLAQKQFRSKRCLGLVVQLEAACHLFHHLRTPIFLFLLNPKNRTILLKTI